MVETIVFVIIALIITGFSQSCPNQMATKPSQTSSFSPLWNAIIETNLPLFPFFSC